VTGERSSQCRCCSEQSSGEKFCEYCQTLLPHITGQRAGLIQDESFIRRFREQLGHPGILPAQIWTRVRRIAGDEWQWALGGRSPQDWSYIADPPMEWRLSDEDFGVIDSGRRNQADDNHLRRLQRGGCLPDGSHLGWAGGTFFLDGRPCKVPYRGLMKVLDRNRHKASTIRWKVLLRSIDLCLTRLSWDRPSGADSEPTVHPAALLLGRSDIGDVQMAFQPLVEMIERNMMGGNSIGVKPRMFERTEWLRRWKEDRHRPVGLSEDDLKVPITLVNRKGRFQLRVRRNRGWKKIEVSSDPTVWARVVTWVLSPPNHDDHRRLCTLQQHIFADTSMPLIGDKDKNGILFLRGLVEANDRAAIDVGMKAIVVEGSSRLRYAVTPGRGGHSTRFIVNPLLDGASTGERAARNRYARWRQMQARRERAICIVETSELRRLVLGDALGSVVLALLDDLNSQRRIDTLRQHIAIHKPRDAIDPETAEHNRAQELRYRLAHNRVHETLTRCSESFPRIWSVLLRLPLGERMTFTAMNRNGPPNITFDDCDTTFRTHDMLDRQVIYRMLEASGWRRDRVEEGVRETLRVYIRIGTGERDLGPAVEEFATMLEPRLLINGRNGMLPGPLWRWFERDNPGTAPLLPGTDQPIG